MQNYNNYTKHNLKRDVRTMKNATVNSFMYECTRVPLETNLLSDPRERMFKFLTQHIICLYGCVYDYLRRQKKPRVFDPIACLISTCIQ